MSLESPRAGRREFGIAIAKNAVPVAPGTAFHMKGKPPRSDRFLQLLGSAKRDLLRSLDVDGFPGGGIASHARGALADLEDAKPNDADALALLQVLGDQRDRVVENGFSLLLGDLLLVGNRRREVLQGDGRRGR